MLKMHRAQEHAQQLTEAVRSFTEDTRHKLRLVSNPAKTEWGVAPEFSGHPDTERWSVIFGDYVHCLRSALDHLVYALAAGDSDEPPQTAKTVMMPLATTLKDFKRSGYRLKDLAETTRDRIEALQPFQDRPQNKLLRMLNDLDVRDKHRLISVVPLYPAASELRLDGLEAGAVMECRTNLRPLQQGQPFVEWIFDRPVPRLTVAGGAQVHAFVRWDDGTGVHAYELHELVERLYWGTRWVVDSLLGDDVDPVPPPEPLTGYQVQVAEEAPDIDHD